MQWYTYNRPHPLFMQDTGTYLASTFLYTQVLWFFESRADWAGALYIKGGWIHWEAPSLMIDSVVMTPLSEPIHIHSLPSSTCQPFFILIQIIPGVLFLNILLRRNQSEEENTQCQLCKRLAGSIIPLSWSGLEEGVTLDVIIRGESTTIFLCSILLVGHFWHSDKQPPKRTTGWS